MVDGEPAARSAEAGHDLVGDHQDSVFVTQRPDALDVAVGRDEDAVRADDRLEEDRGDGVRAFVADDVLEALQGFGRRPRLLLAPAVRVRIADDTHEPGLVGPATRVAGQRHRAHRRVIGAIAGEDLVAPGEVAGQLERVLDRLRAAQREEHLVEVAGQDLGELRAQAGAGLRHERRLDVLELFCLRRDRIDDPPIAVADVDRHQLAVEVEDPAALGRVEVDAFGPIDRDGIDGALDRPGEERVLARQRDDLLAGHAAGCGADAHLYLLWRRRAAITAQSLWSAPYLAAGTAAPTAAQRRMASAERSMSSWVVRQFDTDTRIAATPCQVVPPSQQVPSRCTAAITSRVRASAASSSPPAVNRTRTWLRTTSLRISTPGPSASRSAIRRARTQDRSISSARPSRPSDRSAA